MGRDINLHVSFVRPPELDLAAAASSILPGIIAATNDDDCSTETWAARWFLEELAKEDGKPGLVGRIFGNKPKPPKQMIAWGTTGEFWEPTDFVNSLGDLWKLILQADLSKNILLWTQDEEDECCYELIIALGPEGNLTVSEFAPVAVTWSVAPDIDDLENDEDDEEERYTSPVSPPSGDGIESTPASLIHVSCNSGPDRSTWRQAATQILPTLATPTTPAATAAHDFLQHVVDAGHDPGWMHVWAHWGELDAKDFIEALMPFWEAAVDPWIAVIYSQAAGKPPKGFMLCKPEDVDSDDRPLWILSRDDMGVGYFRDK